MPMPALFRMENSGNRTLSVKFSFSQYLGQQGLFHPLLQHETMMWLLVLADLSKISRFLQMDLLCTHWAHSRRLCPKVMENSAISNKNLENVNGIRSWFLVQSESLTITCIRTCVSPADLASQPERNFSMFSLKADPNAVSETDPTHIN